MPELAADLVRRQVAKGLDRDSYYPTSRPNIYGTQKNSVVDVPGCDVG
jgi:hypothetical protein